MNGEVERVMPELVFLSHLCASGQEGGANGGAVRPRGPMKGGGSRQIHCENVRTGSQEHLTGGPVAAPCGEVERGLATNFAAQHVRPRVDQQTANRIGSSGGSKMQGRRQQTVSDVDVRAVGDEDFAGFGVACTRRQVKGGGTGGVKCASRIHRVRNLHQTDRVRPAGQQPMAGLGWAPLGRVVERVGDVGGRHGRGGINEVIGAWRSLRTGAVMPPQFKKRDLWICSAAS